MERKHLIRPVTILKVKGFLNDVVDNIQAKKNFSLDSLARSHSVSGSMGTALIRLDLIKPSSEIKGFYEFSNEPLVASEQTAIQLLEHIRVRNIDLNKNKYSIPAPLIPELPTPADPGSNGNNKSGDDIKLAPKSVKSPEFTSILEKIFSKMNEGKQTDLFDGVTNVHNERIHVASAISSGVWGSLGLGQDFSRMNEEHIREVNAKIAFTADDLMDQILNFKKSYK